MKTINESPHDFFQQGGWSFLGGAGGEEVGYVPLSTIIFVSPALRQSDPDDASDTESEFEADPEELVSEESDDDVSDYGASDASDDDASGSDFGGEESDEGNFPCLSCWTSIHYPNR
jgi:nucleosome binding factor SPN SPT16 subunit